MNCLKSINVNTNVYQKNELKNEKANSIIDKKNRVDIIKEGIKNGDYKINIDLMANSMSDMLL